MCPFGFHPTHPQALNAQLFATGDQGIYSLDLSDLNLVPLPFAWIRQAVNEYGECAFSADYTVLYGIDEQGHFQTIDQQTGAITQLSLTADPIVYDLGGSSFFGTAGGGGDCYTQYASAKTRVPKAAKRGGYLRYRANLKNTNKTMSSLTALRLEVALPPEVSIVSSSTSLKKEGVVGAVNAGDGTLTWDDFTLKRRKTARFDFKARVSSSATKGQTFDITTTLSQEGTKCPVAKTHTVRT
jgi:hypothetical protein